MDRKRGPLKYLRERDIFQNRSLSSSVRLVYLKTSYFIRYHLLYFSVAPGETIEIAEQEAARQALRNLFGIPDHRPPLKLHGPLEKDELTEFSKPNQCLSAYLT